MQFLAAIVACLCFLGYAFGLDLGTPHALLGVGLTALTLVVVLPGAVALYESRRAA
jgi:hypothetical protein